MNEKRSDETTPAGSVVPPTTISDEAIAAGIEAVRARWRIPVTSTEPHVREDVEAVLAVAVPYIGARLRHKVAAQVAEEIRVEIAQGYTEGSENADKLSDYDSGLADAENAVARVRDRHVAAAARVARGTQEATK